MVQDRSDVNDDERLCWRPSVIYNNIQDQPFETETASIKTLTLKTKTETSSQDRQQQYLFAIGGWKPEGHKPIKAGSKKK